jgi:hypothetical protein
VTGSDVVMPGAVPADTAATVTLDRWPDIMLMQQPLRERGARCAPAPR